MVAGGADNSKRPMSSTETLLVGSASWEMASSLPAAVEGLRGVTIGDDIFLTGGMADNGTRSDVLRYIVARNEWEIVGNMAKPRSAHAATAINLGSEILEYCDKKGL